MRTLSALAALLTFLLVAGGCDSTDDGFTRVDLRTGQTLRYATRVTADSIAYGFDIDVTGRIVARTLSRNQTLGDLTGLTIVTGEQVEDNHPDVTYRSTVWYRPTAERLDEVAYQFAGDGAGGTALRGSRLPSRPGDLSMPQTVRWLAARHGLRRNTSPPPDECPFNCALTLRDEPRVIVAYPAVTGATWTHLSGDAPASTREVLREETIQTPAGTFRCIAVRTRIPSFGDDATFEWVDWIADVGLVQRELTTRTMDPDGAGPVGVITERVTLVAVE